MKILISGATGLVGKAIVAACRKQDIAVNYLTISANKIVSEDNYRGFLWNPAKQEIDINCFIGVSAIINLAGSSIFKKWTSGNKKEILSSRLDSLDTLSLGLKKCKTHKVATLISASAIGIYPSSLSAYYVEDEKVLANDFLGEVVKAWEGKADNLASHDIDVAKIRIGLVLSNEGGALPKMAKPIMNYIGAAFGSGKQWQSWIHEEDLARMFLFVLTEKCVGVYNGVAPNPIDNNKLTKETAITLNKPLLLPNIPEFVLKMILGKMSDLLFGSQRVSSKKIQEHGFVFNYGNICLALANLYPGKNNTRSENCTNSAEYIQ